MYQKILDAITHFLQTPPNKRKRKGLCVQIPRHANHNDFAFALAMWPEHSGNTTYPIEITEDVPRNDLHDMPYTRRAESQYFGHIKSNNNAYSQARERLATHIYTVLLARQTALSLQKE